MNAFATGAGCDRDFAFGGPQVDPRTVLTIFAGDAITLPLTLTGPSTLGPDGVTVVIPGAPIDMTGMTPGAEFLTGIQQPGFGVALAVLSIVPTAGQFTVTVPGRGQTGDLTSGLFVPTLPAFNGPRIRVHYTDVGGQHTFGTFYLRVR